MRRLPILLAACSLVLLTAGCSGDDGEGEGSEDEQPSNVTASSDPEDEKERVAKTQECDAEVSTTGAFEWEWSGQATVSTGVRSKDASGPQAVYALKHKKYQGALYSSGVEFEGSVSLSVGKAFYASDPADAQSLDIDPQGRHAEVDVQLTSTADDVIQFEAEITCGKTPKKKG